MIRSTAFSIAAVALFLGGCAVQLGHKPYLTTSAFQRAAATCNVISEGVHHAIGSKLPYADYRLPIGGAHVDHDDGTHECLAKALTNYRYDYFGEAFAPGEQ